MSEEFRLANVKIALSPVIARGVGAEREVQVSASTLGDALNKIVDKYGEKLRERLFESDNKPRPFLNFYVNGKNACFSGLLEAPLADGDEVVILPSVSGGSARMARCPRQTPDGHWMPANGCLSFGPCEAISLRCKIDRIFTS